MKTQFTTNSVIENKDLRKTLIWLNIISFSWRLRCEEYSADKPVLGKFECIGMWVFRIYSGQGGIRFQLWQEPGQSYRYCLLWEHIKQLTIIPQTSLTSNTPLCHSGHTNTSFFFCMSSDLNVRNHFNLKNEQSANKHTTEALSLPWNSSSLHFL